MFIVLKLFKSSYNNLIMIKFIEEDISKKKKAKGRQVFEWKKTELLGVQHVLYFPPVNLS